MTFRVGTLPVLGAVFLFALLGASPAESRLPKRFFGIAPQTTLTSDDAEWMRSGGIDSIRTDVSWASTEPMPGVFHWLPLDNVVRNAAKAGIQVLPFLYRTPAWVAPEPERLPIDNPRQRQAWMAFVRAVVSRYGPGGSFWREHGPLSLEPLAPQPIRRWQMWNEQNFFYFTKPASPRRYARFVKISRRALTAADPGSQLILGGLFAHPRESYPDAMKATSFLRAFYRVRGIEHSFDGVAIHPYAASARRLPPTLRAVRRIMVANRDRRTGIWITEIGWGSQGSGGGPLEKGLAGQARELRRAYRYLTSRARARLNLKQVHWFSWKDATGPACSFCDSAGLFRQGPGFSPKPAWHAFTRFARGRDCGGCSILRAARADRRSRRSTS